MTLACGGESLASPRLLPSAYPADVRRSSSIAFGIAWGVFLCVTFYAWEKVLSVPDGRGDVRGLTVATVAGGFGLAFIGAYVQDRERGD